MGVVHSRPLFAACVAASVGLWAGPADAQFEPYDEGIEVGDWTFYPSLDLRVRGEYRRNPPVTGGDQLSSTAVLAHEPDTVTAPRAGRVPVATDQWFVAERSRLGLTVAWEALTGVLVLQDARVLGIVPGAPGELDSGGSGWFGPYQAYIGIATPDDDDWQVDVRIGRQNVTWGDGRLIGGNDWTHRGSFLDAARLLLRFDDVEIEALGALLAVPGALPPELSDRSTEPVAQDGYGSGAQLYGLDLAWHALPLLNLELAGLVRLAREPLPTSLAPSDTYVIDGRVFGEHRGVRYAVEGAYQLGRVASHGSVRDLSAFAVAGNVSWLTALPWSFEFGVEGGYASGHDPAEAPDSTITRFDPILPEVHQHHGMMDAYAWTNLIEAGGFVGAQPFEEGTFRLGFDFIGLAEPAGRWTSGTLVPVGAAPTNESQVLGYEWDLGFELSPWDPLAFGAGYSLLLLGDGGRNVLAAAGRGEPDLLHFGYLQARLQAP